VVAYYRCPVPVTVIILLLENRSAIPTALNPAHKQSGTTLQLLYFGH